MIGDAAHAVYPNVGAGATYAMADPMHLAATVREVLASSNTHGTTETSSVMEPLSVHAHAAGASVPRTVVCDSKV